MSTESRSHKFKIHTSSTVEKRTSKDREPGGLENGKYPADIVEKTFHSPRYQYSKRSMNKWISINIIQYNIIPTEMEEASPKKDRSPRTPSPRFANTLELSPSSASFKSSCDNIDRIVVEKVSTLPKTPDCFQDEESCQDHSRDEIRDKSCCAPPATSYLIKKAPPLGPGRPLKPAPILPKAIVKRQTKVLFKSLHRCPTKTLPLPQSVSVLRGATNFAIPGIDRKVEIAGSASYPNCCVPNESLVTRLGAQTS